MAHGQAARDRVAGSVKLYAGRLGALGLSWRDVRDLADGFLPAMDSFSPEHVEEMRGLAEGAGEELAAIVLVNARTEILQLGRRRAASGCEARGGEGCTTVVVAPERSTTGAVIHGHNWDWRAACAHTSIVLLVRREDGPDVLTFTEAGALARHGLNGAGLALTGNYLRSDRDDSRIGVPLTLIRRKALEAAEPAVAISIVATTPKSTSNNMTISRDNGQIVNLECAPDEAFVTTPESGLLVHTNHWTSPIALSKLREAGLDGEADTLFRAWRVKALLGGRERIGPEQVTAALLDDMDAPHSVCQPVRDWGPGDAGATVATLVFEPKARSLSVAPMPACGASFTCFALEPLGKSTGARLAAAGGA